MKKNSLILLAFISLVAVFTSCEPEYFKPTNPKYEVGDLITIDGVDAVVYFVSFDGDDDFDFRCEAIRFLSGTCVVGAEEIKGISAGAADFAFYRHGGGGGAH